MTRLHDLMTGLVLSVALHGFLFWPGGEIRPAEAVFDRGVSAVRITLAPSAASVERVARSVPSPVPETLPEPSREHFEKKQDAAAESGPQAPAAPEGTQPAAGPVHPAGNVSPASSAQPAPRTVEQDGSLEEKGVTTPAELSGTCRPHYPRLSRKLGHEGTVRLRVTVGLGGRAQSISLLQTSGYTALDQAASTALRQAVFNPARRGGKPVGSVQEFDFDFKLEDPAP